MFKFTSRNIVIICVFCVNIVNVSCVNHFPLNIPADVKKHFNFSLVSEDHSDNFTTEFKKLSRIPRDLSQESQFENHQQLTIPEPVKEYYSSTRSSQRSGRQIVPGVYSCGHQGKDQFINFINPHYPSPDNVAGTCHFRMVTSDPGVCQIRVDFVDTELLSPERGDCNDQYLIVSGAIWNPGFHKLCGINPDQHFYLHLDKGMGFQHVDFTITSVTPNVPYKFGLWITQVNCFDGSSIMAPGGCTQYHFGVQYLNNQNYKTCMRSERGACYMELQADSNHFMLEPVKAEDMAKEIRQEQRAQAVHEAMGLGFLSPSPNRNRRKQYGRPNAKAGDMYCAADYILIPGGQDTKKMSEMSHSHDRYCGGFLNADNDAKSGASVFARIQGSVFWVQLVTGRRGLVGGNVTDFDQTLHGPGVRIRYSQHLHCVETDLVN